MRVGFNQQVNTDLNVTVSLHKGSNADPNYGLDGEK